MSGVITQENCGICIPLHNWSKLSLNITMFMDEKNPYWYWEKEIIFYKNSHGRVSVHCKSLAEGGDLMQWKPYKASQCCRHQLKTVFFHSGILLSHTYWSSIDVKSGHAESLECQNWDLHCGPESSILPFYENRAKFDWKLLIHSTQTSKKTYGLTGLVDCLIWLPAQ